MAQVDAAVFEAQPKNASCPLLARYMEEVPLDYRPGLPGAAVAFFTANRFCVALLPGRAAGCATTQNGGFGAGQWPRGTAGSTASSGCSASTARSGPVALSLCTTAHPRYPTVTNLFSTSISETTMRPNPTASAAPSLSPSRRAPASSPGSGTTRRRARGGRPAGRTRRSSASTRTCAPAGPRLGQPALHPNGAKRERC